MNEEQLRLIRITVTHVASVLAAVICLCEGQAPLSSVGQGCTKHTDCVPGAQCKAEKCVCPSGFGQLVDSSKCLNLASQMVTNVMCMDNMGCNEVGEKSTCLKFTSTSFRCICDSNLTLPNTISCFLACKNHKTCVLYSRKTVCMQKNTSTSTGPDITYCGSRRCLSDDDCNGISGTECLAQISGSTIRYCMANIQIMDSNNTHSAKEEKFGMYLLLGAGGVGVGLLVVIVCIILVTTGKCSGDLKSKPIRGRGVPAVRKRLPPYLGGARPGSRQAFSRSRQSSTASRGSRPASRSVSAGSIHAMPTRSRSNMSLATPTSSVVNSSVYSDGRSSSIHSRNPSRASLARSYV